MRSLKRAEYNKRVNVGKKYNITDIYLNRLLIQIAYNFGDLDKHSKAGHTRRFVQSQRDIIAYLNRMP